MRWASRLDGAWRDPILALAAMASPRIPSPVHNPQFGALLAAVLALFSSIFVGSWLHDWELAGLVLVGAFVLVLGALLMARRLGSG